MELLKSITDRSYRVAVNRKALGFTVDADSEAEANAAALAEAKTLSGQDGEIVWTRKFTIALFFILAALPALAQHAPAPRPVKMPTLAAPAFRVPKPAIVQMPKPTVYSKRFPIVKPVHFPPPHYSR